MTVPGGVRVLGAMLVWSSWGLFVRWLTLPGWSVSFFVGIAATVGGLAVGFVGMRTRGYSFPSKRQLNFLAFLGLLLLANSVLFLSAFEFTSIANAVLSHYTAPVFVAVMAPFIIGERLVPATVAAVVLGCVGMYLLLAGEGLSVGSDHLAGIALGAGSGLFYGLLVIFSKKLVAEVPVPFMVAVTNFVVALGLAPWVTAGEVWPIGADWWMLCVLGLVHATAAPIIYLSGLKRVRAQTAAVLGYFEPLGALILASAVFGEMPPFAGWLGGLLIIVGGALVIRTR